MKITTQLRATLVGLFVIALGGVASVYFNSAGDLSRPVNFSGIVRGASQRLVKLELAGKESDELIAKLDKIINGLINGDEELELPAAKDPEFRQKMQEVQTAFEGIKQLIAQVRRDPSFQDELLADSEDYFELTNESVFAAEDYAKAVARRAELIEISLFLLEIVVLALIWYVNRRIILILQGSTNTLAGTSNQIATTMQEQERTISEQASSVTQTTTTVEQLGASTRQSAEQAESSAAGARQALDLVEAGNRSVEQALDGISTLKEQVSSIAEQIMRLSEQTGQISLVSELVGNIANQTNMLALNASVEAARAGEQGKGFSVVAGEIRKLADQSKKSSEKINTLVRDVQASLNSTVMVTDEGTKKADLGIKLAQDTAETFSGVTDAVNNAFLNSQQIAMTSKQQAVAVQEVLSAINELDLAAKETASAIKQVKVSTEQLDQEAQKLKAAV